MTKALPVLGQAVQRTPQIIGQLRDRAQAKAIPYHALVYLENKCHMKCAHCYEDETTHPTDDRLSVDELRVVLEDLAALGTLQLTFSGGEIFLRRDLFEILAIAKKLRFWVTLFTSGTLIDRAKAERLKELNIGQVDISIYSDRAADHDAFTRIPGSHARSMQALRLLREVGVPTVLKCVLTTFSVDRIDHIMQLARDVGADFQFDANVRPRMSNDRSTLVYALDAKTIADKVYSRRDLYPGFREVTPDRVCRGTGFRHGDDAMCGAGSATMAIAADGGLLPCAFFPMPVGNVREHRLRELWERSSTLQEMRQMTYNKMTACTSCDLQSACHPCMAYAQVEHGDFKQCNTASEVAAEALTLLAERGARTNAKFERAGRALPIVGDRTLPDDAPGAVTTFD